MRRIALAVGALFTVIVLAWGVLSVASVAAHKTTRTEVSFRAGITTIELALGGGSIDISAGNVDRITGVRTVERGLVKPKISEVQSADSLRLDTSCSGLFSTNCAVHYKLTVPASISVVGASAGGGITVKGTTGSVDVTTAGGGIRIESTAGTLTLESAGGGISVIDGLSSTVKASPSACMRHPRTLTRHQAAVA
jgi:hypothetical protein